MVCLITLLVMNVVWYLQHEDTTSPCVHTLSFTVQLIPGLIMQLVCFALCSAYDITLRMLFQYHTYQEATAAGTAGVDLQMEKAYLVFLIHFNPLST